MRRMIVFLGICAAFVLCANCSRNVQSPPPAANTEKPAVSSAPARDEEMEKATMTARATVGNFLAALKSRNRDKGDFAFKKTYQDGAKTEQIWLSKVTFDGKKLRGVVTDEPVEVTNVKVGDKAAVLPEEISDWMYVENGVLKGGYTIRVFYKRQSPEKQKQFFDETGLVFEEHSGATATGGQAGVPSK